MIHLPHRRGLVHAQTVSIGVLLALVCFHPSLCAHAQGDLPETASGVRVITCGWNAPTVAQYARDIHQMPGELPFTGAVLTLHADSGNPDPLATAHSTDDWGDLDVQRSISAIAASDTSLMPDNYLLVKLNPGNVDWMDQAGWNTIVQHYRVAARLAKAGGLRGLLLDFEPYTAPYRQFQYSRQAQAADHSFLEYKTIVRSRGRAVMQAIAEEFPDIELCTYFLLSYLIDDHPYRGPSPAGRSDADWCMAGHSYGLIPAFVDGMLDVAPPEITLIDGCENGYWFQSDQPFKQCAEGVRGRAALLLSPANREKYRSQIRVAFPIYLDAIHPTLAGRYTLQPKRTDRLNLFQRNFHAAAKFGDGLVWLYGEHGRWWPEAGEEALWKGKDTYPHWEQQIPGLSAALQSVVQTSFKEAEQRDIRLEADSEIQQDTSAKNAGNEQPPASADGTLEATVLETEPTWTTWNESDVGTAILADGQVTITAADDASGLASLDVKPNRRYMIQVQVVQQGRGLTRLSVRWRTADGKWDTDQTHDVIAYPPDGDPTKPRTINLVATSPPQPRTLVVICNASRQLDENDAALFGNLMIGIVDQLPETTEGTNP